MPGSDLAAPVVGFAVLEPSGGDQRINPTVGKVGRARRLCGATRR